MKMELPCATLDKLFTSVELCLHCYSYSWCVWRRRKGRRRGWRWWQWKSKYFLQLKSENNFRLLDGDHVLITLLEEVKYEWLNWKLTWSEWKWLINTVSATVSFLEWKTYSSMIYLPVYSCSKMDSISATRLLARDNDWYLIVPAICSTSYQMMPAPSKVFLC